MTEQKHTPEPWKIGAIESGQVVIDAANGSEVTGWLDPDDARRIVACVNACAGIETEDLERHYNAGGGIDSAMEEAGLQDNVKVWQQRDQLAQRVVELQELHSEEMARYQQLQNHALGTAKQCDQLRAALVGMVDVYTALVNSGDCGFWDPEKDAEVMAARSALATTEGV